ncbi:MAG: ABC transporter substrate-binding protein [Bacteroidetes bacterium]|jgi:iron complex transport system substrate-binding protein|nr:ABC transporter substrate-binding protein [Bacteroidota bacterium]
MNTTTLLEYWVFALLCVSLFGCQAEPQDTVDEPPSYERLVSLSGGITELLYELGQGDKIVGIDVTSTYPADKVAQLPRLGHVRQLNVEALLSLQPDLVLAERTDEASAALQQLEGAGVEVLWLDGSFSLEKPMAQAEQISQKLELGQELKRLRQAYEADKKRLQQVRQAVEGTPKVLFIYARGKGSLMVAGKNTAASAMIELAGGQNAVQSFEGFRALSAEGLMQAQPEVLLLFKSGLQSLGGVDGLLQVPGLAQTPAGQQGHIIGMDGLYLLGFTPRAARAAADLSERLQALSDAYTLN